ARPTSTTAGIGAAAPPGGKVLPPAGRTSPFAGAPMAASKTANASSAVPPAPCCSRTCAPAAADGSRPSRVVNEESRTGECCIRRSCRIGKSPFERSQQFPCHRIYYGARAAASGAETRAAASAAAREAIVHLDLLAPRVVAPRFGRMPAGELPERRMPAMSDAPSVVILAVALLGRRRLAFARLDRGLQALGKGARVRPPRGVDRPVAVRLRRAVLVEEVLQPGDLGLLRGEGRRAFGEPAPGLGLGETRDAQQATDAVDPAHDRAAAAGAGRPRPGAESPGRSLAPSAKSALSAA